MTDRLADISARIEGIRQLAAVVNAMKGIAASRVHTAQTQLEAVDSYAAMIAAAMARVIGGRTVPAQASKPEPQPAGLLVFCAEQGFAGGFSERVLDRIEAAIDPERLFLIGTRGAAIAQARGIDPAWQAAMPQQGLGIPKLADTITQAIYQAVASARIDRLDVVFTQWVSGRPHISRMSLFPIDLAALPEAGSTPPLLQMPQPALIDSLGQDYFHAQVCRAALHALASENQARLEAMTAAGSQIARELVTFEAKLRSVRQEAITAEIIELGQGASPKRRSH